MSKIKEVDAILNELGPDLVADWIVNNYEGHLWEKLEALDEWTIIARAHERCFGYACRDRAGKGDLWRAAQIKIRDAMDETLRAEETLAESKTPELPQGN